MLAIAQATHGEWGNSTGNTNTRRTRRQAGADLALLIAAMLAGCKPATEAPAKPGKTLAAPAATNATDCGAEACMEPAKGAVTATVDDEDAALQQQLLRALKPQADGSDRFLQADPVIKAYADTGYIHGQADTRMDYSDYHLLQRPAKLLGHQLLLIDNDYMQEYVGCCVSHGLSVTVKLLPEGEDLQVFAAANDSAFNPDEDEYFPARDAGLPPAPVGTYANNSCKERDVPLDD